MRPVNFAVLSLSLLLGACDRAPSADGLAEWKPSDHDRLADQRAQAQAGPQQPAPRPATETPLPPGHPSTGDAGAAAGGSAAMSAQELADMAWNSQCVSCHGPLGRGDGPQGPMMRPPDFSSKEWQAQRSDAELAASIANGKNKMPKFGLPERVISALVARVRAFAP